MTTSTSNKIAELNDQFRKNLTLGVVNRTNRVTAIDAEKLMQSIASFDNFTEDNDPWREHDFGSIELDGECLFWKIDYYDLQLEYQSEDPADTNKTKRVMTIMFADEY